MKAEFKSISFYPLCHRGLNGYFTVLSPSAHNVQYLWLTRTTLDFTSHRATFYGVAIQSATKGIRGSHGTYGTYNSHESHDSHFLLLPGLHFSWCNFLRADTTLNARHFRGVLLK